MRKYLYLLIFMIACGGAKESVPATLTETKWKLTELDGQKIKQATDEKLIHIVFYTEDSRLSGFGGCNNLIGNYILTEPDQLFMIVASTRMFCEGEMETESKLLELLTEVEYFEINKQTLSLKNSKTVVAKFEATELAEAN
ncbi:MAG TPA: META domain-containing protein [Cyclobacteriaceae bacterium]|nr:META domain-containing protein [Cyclobacteriaceae bacterium]